MFAAIHSANTCAIRLFQSMLIGLAAMLPGVSGGVLCVAFDVYQPIMRLLADPLHTFKADLPPILPHIAGAALGFFGVARLLSRLMARFPAPSIALFVGLVLGMLPKLLQEAGSRGRSKGSIASLILSSALILCLLTLLRHSSFTIKPSVPARLLCGFALAISLVVPGMSFSTLLMPLDLYDPFLAGISMLNPAVLLPAVAGTLMGLMLLPRAVNALYGRYFSIVSHAVVGTTFAATIAVIPYRACLASTQTSITCLVATITGFIVAYLSDLVKAKT